MADTPVSLTDRDSEDTRAFYQARMATYLLIYGSVGASFVAMRVLGGVLSGAPWSTFLDPSFVPHVFGAAFSYGGWLLVRSGHKSVDYLERVENATLLLSMGAYAAMGFYTPLAFSPVETVMLALSLGLFARAIYVPSSARRSLGLALAIAVPHLAITIYAPFRVAPMERDNVANSMFVDLIELYTQSDVTALTMAVSNALGLALWWVGTIVLTTGASRVIYDLREEVKDVRKLGQYQLEEQLGAGGMGIVHRASHAMLQRPTAVKLLPAELVGEQSLARFEREVRQTARLTHPNTVTIFDYGRTPRGVFYYAMELLDGANLDEVVERGGPLAPGRVVHILRQVCGSLQEAHAIQLIHRDIKPANIMLCERGGMRDTVKVLDFGLVKELAKSDAASLTQADVVTGTPQYLPPEAITAPESIDARSDIYSLGAVAFLLLTGEDLFNGATVVEICSHHLHTAPRRPSQLVASVPADVEALVMACIAKKPSERPASAAALEEALDACACARDWTRRDAERWWNEHASA